MNMAWDDDATVTGANITGAEWNALVTYIKSVISASGTVTPTKIVIPSGGLPIYASDGVTQIGSIDESGNLLMKGMFGQL